MTDAASAPPQPERTTGSPRTIKPPSWAIWAIPALLALIVFRPSLEYGFLLDDHRYIEDNVVLRSASGAYRSFLYSFPPHQPSLAQYRPLLGTTLALDYTLAPKTGRRKGGVGSPLVGGGPFHLTNVALHIGTTLFVVALALSFFGSDRRWAALVAGALFAVHPVHVEAVANITGRGEVQAAFFYLAATWMLWRIDPGRAWSRNFWLWGTVACFSAALFTKESAITFPLLAALLLLLRRDDTNAVTQRLALLLPLVAVVALYLTVRIYVLAAIAIPAENTFFFDRPELAKLPTMSFVALLYAILLVLPTHFNPRYDFPVHLFHNYRVDAIEGWTAPALLGLIIAAGVLAATAYYAAKRSRIAPALLLLVVPLVVFSHIVPFGDWAAERFLYLPSVGFCLAAGWLLGRIPLLPVRVAVCALLVGLLALRSHIAEQAWASPQAFGDLLDRANPEAPIGPFVLGQDALHRASEERVDLLRAIATGKSPSQSVVRARQSSSVEGYRRAIHHHLEALERDPRWVQSRHAILEAARNTAPPQRDLAEEQYDWFRKEGFDLLNSPASLWHYMAQIELDRKDYKNAYQLTRAARHVYDPGGDASKEALLKFEAEILNHWSIERFEARDYRNALVLSSQAIQRDEHIPYIRNFARMLEETGELPRALDQWRYLAKRQPGEPAYAEGIERVSRALQIHLSRTAERRRELEADDTPTTATAPDN